jgi:hypothetical protein
LLKGLSCVFKEVKFVDLQRGAITAFHENFAGFNDLQVFQCDQSLVFHVPEESRGESGYFFKLVGKVGYVAVMKFLSDLR